MDILTALSRQAVEPADPDEQAQLVSAHLLQGRWADALESLRNIRRAYPHIFDDVDFWEYLAHMLWENGRLPRVLRFFVTGYLEQTEPHR